MLRIGFQARVGVDTIVAGHLPPMVLSDDGSEGATMILGGDPPGRIGDQSEVGRTARLGEGTLRI
jgi:hypothetical protein